MTPNLGPNVQAWVRMARRRVRMRKDLLCLIGGPERSGKSTLAYELGEAIDPTFGPDRMCFDQDELVQKALRLPPGSVIVLDEPIYGAWSGDAQSRENKNLAKFWTICGERYLIGIIIHPNKKKLDANFREHRCLWWMHVFERRDLTKSTFKAHKAVRNPYTEKTYWKALFTADYGPRNDPSFLEYQRRKSAFVARFGQTTTTDRQGAAADLEELSRIRVLLRDVPTWIQEAAPEDYQSRRRRYVRAK